MDNVNGDLYNFSEEIQALVPVGNIGLHNYTATGFVGKTNKFMMKPPVHNPKKIPSLDKDLMIDGSEMMCYIQKHLLGHWLFENCDNFFVVPTKARWEVHSFSFVNKDRVFQGLAESDKGLLIIEFPNIIAVKFDINRKYPNTVKILNNFIIHKLKELANHNTLMTKSVLIYEDVTENLKGGLIFTKKSKDKTLVDPKNTENFSSLIDRSSSPPRKSYTSENSRTHPLTTPFSKIKIGENSELSPNENPDKDQRTIFRRNSTDSWSQLTDPKQNKNPQKTMSSFLVDKNNIANMIIKVEKSKKDKNNNNNLFSLIRQPHLKRQPSILLEFNTPNKHLSNKSAAEILPEINLLASASIVKKVQIDRRFVEDSSRTRNMYDSQLSNSPKSPKSPKLSKSPKFSKSQKILKIKEDNTLKQAGIRKLLYPGLEDNYISKQDLWVIY